MEGSSLTPQGATKAEARWLGASMKGRRRTCSPFEMLFKKSLLKAAAVKDTTNLVGRNGRRGSTGFAISGLRPDLEDNTVLDIASYRREFNKFDANKDGEIDKAEFGQFLRGIGLIPSDDEVKEIYEQIDKNNDGTIVFEEFVTVLDHPKVNLSRGDVRNSIEETLKKLTPTLRLGELRRILTDRGKMKMTDEEVDDLIKRLKPGEERRQSAEIEVSAMVDVLMTENCTHGGGLMNS